MERFGKLTVDFSKEYTKNRKTYVFASCDCGVEKYVRKDSILNGHTSSCGCSAMQTRFKKKHGMFGTKLYQIWANMKDRCLNPDCRYFKHYGGRGISVCERWLTFENFFFDLFLDHQEGLSLDRIDNNKGYCPENCRWATAKMQTRNRRSNRKIQVGNEKLCINEIAERIGMNVSTFYARISKGWGVDRAVNEPVHAEFQRKETKHGRKCFTERA
jgi:hypothetical protein